MNHDVRRIAYSWSVLTYLPDPFVRIKATTHDTNTGDPTKLSIAAFRRFSFYVFSLSGIKMYSIKLLLCQDKESHELRDEDD